MNRENWKGPMWLYKILGKKIDTNTTALETKVDDAVTFIENLFKSASNATASSNDILYGKTAYNGTTLLTGLMPDKSAVTVAAENVTDGNTDALIGIPSAGYYDTSSKLKVPVDVLKENVSELNSSSNISVQHVITQCFNGGNQYLSLKTNIKSIDTDELIYSNTKVFQNWASPDNTPGKWYNYTEAINITV